MLSILADTEAAITAGDSGAALDLLRNLRRHTDGCGATPDRNDWVRTCPAQQTLVPPIDDLVASLGG